MEGARAPSSYQDEPFADEDNRFSITECEMKSEPDHVDENRPQARSEQKGRLQQQAREAQQGFRDHTRLIFALTTHSQEPDASSASVPGAYSAYRAATLETASSRASSPFSVHSENPTEIPEATAECALPAQTSLVVEGRFVSHDDLSSGGNRNRWIVFGVMICVAIVAITVGAVIGARAMNDDAKIVQVTATRTCDLEQIVSECLERGRTGQMSPSVISEECEASYDLLLLFWIPEAFPDFSLNALSCQPANMALYALTGSSEGNQTDSSLLNQFVLAVLYFELNGTQTRLQEEWLWGGDECEWDGVKCDAKTREVVEIEVGRLGLQGTLPSEMGLLTSLTALNAYENNIEGPIPSSLGELSRLETLDFSLNHLTGLVPVNIFTLPKLRAMSFHANRLSGTIPTEVGFLASLEMLDFARAGLSGTIPSEIGLCRNLRFLQLFMTQLSGGLPSEIGGLERLESFMVFESSLAVGHLPLWLWKMPTLRQLGLSRCGIGGSLPSEIGLLSDLDFLGLDDNNIDRSIPTDIGSLHKLTTLDFSKNHVSGSLPSEIGNLLRLRSLHVNDNELTGNIPTELGKLTDLRRFRLSSNNLSGTIPSQICALWEYSLETLAGQCVSDPYGGLECPSEDCCRECSR